MPTRSHWTLSPLLLAALFAGCQNPPVTEPGPEAPAPSAMPDQAPGVSTPAVSTPAVSPPAVSTPAVSTPAQAADDQRVAELLASLSLKEKAGQLFVAWMRADAPEKTRAGIKAELSAGTLGGVILSKGTSADAYAAIQDLLDVPGVPPWFAGDFEAGLAFRFPDATDFGNQMLIGATGDTQLAYEAGRVTGVEGHALGIHWNFAPVFDVNSNPSNPIINVRAFGGDPQRVAKFGVAYSRGLQDAGMLACAKHFPGHGDVATDSHLEMPTVSGSKADLMGMEMLPFQAAFDAGTGAVGSVMCGHLAVPGLGEKDGVPATLSSRILTGVLREEMGFQGLLVTDALDMGGVAGGRTPEQVSVQALAAGADILLMPPNPKSCRDAVVAAVQNGEVPMARLDDAVRRVLQAKADYGALDGLRPDPGWQGIIRQKSHQALAQEIAQKGLTAVRIAEDALPILGTNEPVLLVHIQDKAGPRHSQLEAGLRAAGLTVEVMTVTPLAKDEVEMTPAEKQQQVALWSRDIGRMRGWPGPVVAALYAKVRSYSGSIGLPPRPAKAFETVAQNPRCIAVSFGNPYLILDQPYLPTYLCAYADTPATGAAVAAGLTGMAPIRGQLPVDIPGLADMGTGHWVGQAALQPWTDDATELEGAARGLSASNLIPTAVVEELQGALLRAVGERVFPGAVLAISRGGERLVEFAVGAHTYPDSTSGLGTEPRPMAVDDAFDLASLSKVCATTPATLRLMELGKLTLQDKVVDHVPGFTGGGKDDIRIWHLLTHTAGLKSHDRFWDEAEGRDGILAQVVATPLDRDDDGQVFAPGARYKYSDLGMILLMACVESAAGMPFQQAAQELVFDPMGMETAGYVTPEDPARDAVPTELDEARGGVMRGRVHDENAFAMGGVSGHAGLFGTADDVLRAGNLFVGRGLGHLLPSTVLAATQSLNVPEGSHRGLGWDTARRGWWGSNPPPEVFGHTGFTGTSVWCDPVTGTTVVLLTNRVHPSRENSRITPVRRAVHDIVQRWLGR